MLRGVVPKRIGSPIRRADEFVRRTGVDWLSVAVGSVHGSINPASQGQGKIAARLDIDHLASIDRRTRIPLVLHGGSAIPTDYLKRAFASGISTLNIAADLRKPYEAAALRSREEALEAVEARWAHNRRLNIEGSAEVLSAGGRRSVPGLDAINSLTDKK
jgi:fructose/tagatose bisphosphate aldolase